MQKKGAGSAPFFNWMKTASQKVQILCCAASLAALAYAKYASLLGICAPLQFYEIGETFIFAVEIGLFTVASKFAVN